MTTFKYSFISKFIYRYSNFLATFLLLIHALVSFSGLWIDWINIFPLAINLLVIYLLNRFFFRIYKYFPFKIEIDNKKIICSDFFIRKDIVEIKLADIDKIEGGVFSKKPTTPLYLHVSGKDIKIGLLQHITNFNKLLTIILSNINTRLYHDLMDGIKANKDRSRKKNEKSPD